MVDFNVIIQNLIDVGFYDIFLPFILVYVVVFGVLQKSGIFSSEPGKSDDQTKNINAVIAFVFGLFVVASIQTVKYMQNLIIDIVLVLIFLLCTMLLLGFIFGKDYFQHLFHGKDGKVHKGLVWTVASIVILVSLGILFWILGVWDWLDEYLDWSWDGNLVSEIIIFAVIIAILVWVTNGGKKSESSK